MPIYFQSNNPHGYIVLNFAFNPVNELPIYAEGYHSAGKRLVELMKESPYADYDGLPIIFLYRHALELYLKAVVCKGALMLKLLDLETIDTSKLYENHNLKMLFNDVKKLSKRLNWSWETEDGRFQNIEDFERVLMTIHKLDPGSYSFRYPVDKNVNPCFEHNTQMNVIEFADIMDIFLTTLDSSRLQLEHESDFILEQKLEFIGYLS